MTKRVRENDLLRRRRARGRLCGGRRRRGRRGARRRRGCGRRRCAGLGAAAGRRRITRYRRRSGRVARSRGDRWRGGGRRNARTCEEVGRLRSERAEHDHAADDAGDDVVATATSGALLVNLHTCFVHTCALTCCALTVTLFASSLASGRHAPPPVAGTPCGRTADEPTEWRGDAAKRDGSAPVHEACRRPSEAEARTAGRNVGDPD